MLSIHIIRVSGKANTVVTLRAMPKSFDFRHAPGHLIRRAHQLAVAIFMEETSDFGVTPVQFGASAPALPEAKTDSFFASFGEPQ